MDFDAFVAIAANFLEPEDDEAMAAELKEAFRLYDKEGESERFPRYRVRRAVDERTVSAQATATSRRWCCATSSAPSTTS